MSEQTPAEALAECKKQRPPQTNVFAGEVINGENTYAVYLHEKGVKQIREIIREELKLALRKERRLQ